MFLLTPVSFRISSLSKWFVVVVLSLVEGLIMLFSTSVVTCDSPWFVADCAGSGSGSGYWSVFGPWGVFGVSFCVHLFVLRHSLMFVAVSLSRWSSCLVKRGRLSCAAFVPSLVIFPMRFLWVVNRFLALISHADFASFLLCSYVSHVIFCGWSRYR